MIESIKPHSKLGIASCVIGLITFLIFLLVLIFWLSAFPCPGCSEDLRGNLMFGSIVVLLAMPIPIHIVGFMLGVVSLVFPNRKKLFPIVGVVLNLIFGLIGSFPLLLGMVLAA